MFCDSSLNPLVLSPSALFSAMISEHLVKNGPLCLPIKARCALFHAGHKDLLKQNHLHWTPTVALSVSENPTLWM